MTLRPNTRLNSGQRIALEEKCLKQFITEAVNFYDNPERLKEINFECKISRRMTSALASLEHLGHIGVAEDRRLITVPHTIIFRIARKTLNMTDEDIAKVIRHEVIHIGHMNHGPIFKRLCVAFDASYRGWNLSTVTIKPYEVQIQQGYGTRFKTIGKYDTYVEALRKIQTALATMTGTQLRIKHRRKATIDDLGGH